MKIYIWEGDISDAYHRDGTLVVLADSPEQALDIAKSTALARAHDYEAVGADVISCYEDNCKKSFEEHELTTYMKDADKPFPRLPDEALDLDQPKIVAFNGGGYD